MSNSVFAPRHVYFPTNEHRTTIIFLHDKNSTGPGLASHLANSTAVPTETLYQHFPSTRWVFPSARAKHFYWTEMDRQQLSQSNKDSTTAWFQSNSFPDIQLATLQESTSYILRIIDDEIVRGGDDPEKIFLVGVGQGTALGLVVLLCIHHKIGGFIGLNGWMPFAETLSTLLEQTRVEEAGGFFKSKFIAAAQHTYLQRNHQQQGREGVAPLSPQITESMAPRAVVPDHVKQIPVFLSYSQSEIQWDSADQPDRILTLLRQIGFSQASQKTHLGEDDTRTPFEDSNLLRDMVGIFEELGLAGSQLSTQ